MKRISIVLGLAVLMAATVVMTAGAALARATTETSNVSSPASFTIDNPCQGYEEPILVEGVFHNVVQVTQVDLPNTQPGTDIYKYTIRTNSRNVTGTGLDSGDEYRFINAGGEVGGSFSQEVGTPQGAGGTDTYEVSYMIVSDGASPNFMYHETSKLVVSSDSHPSLHFQNSRTSCTGGVETSPLTAADKPTATATPTATAQPLP